MRLGMVVPDLREEDDGVLVLSVSAFRLAGSIVSDFFAAVSACG
jgi:hypothetical protein